MSDNDSKRFDGESRIHIDESWKDRARREKEQLAKPAAGKAEAAATGEGPGDPSAAGSPNFLMFVTGLAAQAMLFMGLIPSPDGEQIDPSPEEAKAMIDLLDMLQQKTKGNLDEQEASTLKHVLYDLRMAYVHMNGK